MNATCKEIWLPIPGHEGAYEVSNQGRVRSLDHTVLTRAGVAIRRKGQLLKPRTAGARHKRYLKVWLTHADQRTIHSLVAEAFIGPRPDGAQVCHNDGDRTNNRAENLRYGTPSENNLDVVSHGKHRNAAKTHCPQGHVLRGTNLTASELPNRKCRSCAAAHAWVQRHPHGDFARSADEYYARFTPQEAA